MRGGARERDREELRLLLRSQGILHATPAHPITGRDGRPAPWTLYTPAVTLTPRGAALAATCMLPLLRRFRSTQLASFGYTGIPLLTACLARGAPRYTGLMIREVRKARGTGRQVEGPIDRSRPAVIVDDSISSGASFRAAVDALAEEGVAVEGAACLVRFPYRGGPEWATALGYRIETVFDIWDDIGMERPEYVPGYLRAMPAAWADEAVPDALHPAAAARFVAERFLADGAVLRPPARFDDSYDGRGGVYVSFREAAGDRRLARDGFFHFDPAAADACRDVVLATVKALTLARGAIDSARLSTLKIAVSFLDALEAVNPGRLDFDTYGVVVRSRYWPTKIGGALPHTQVFISEAEQYRHARVTNARIGPHEPHDLYRHHVVKAPEPGAYWLPFGATVDPVRDWTRDRAIGGRLIARARAALAPGRALDRDAELPDDLVPAPVSGVAATLYAAGTVGCGVAWHHGRLDDTIRRAVAYAADDTRFADRRPATSPADLEMSVSLLHDREWLGTIASDRVARKLRPGLDAFSVHQGDHHGVFLESVIPHHSWPREQAVERLLAKAHIESGPAAWATYRATTWLGAGEELFRLEYGFPERGPAAAGSGWLPEAVKRSSDYLYRSLDANGVPAYRVEPVGGTTVSSGPVARQLHGLAALLLAGRALHRTDWEAGALRGARHFVDGLEATEAQDGADGPLSGALARFELLALAALAGDPPTAPLHRLAASLRTMFQRDGRVAGGTSPSRRREDHDFLPGVAILAFALAAGGPTLPRAVRLRRHLAWYRRRFRLTGSWGLAAWHMQAWAAVHAREPLAEYADFVFELADWAVERQLETSGAFLTDLSPGGPSFHTAFVAEGIADAWALARRCGDEERAGRYSDSWRRAMEFMQVLTILPQDTFCMRLGDAAIGGVRPSRTASDVRVDYVSHTLTALLKGLANDA